MQENDKSNSLPDIATAPSTFATSQTNKRLLKDQFQPCSSS